MFDLSHLHPMIVHFPIALVIIGFIADLAGIIFKNELYKKAANYLVVIGSVGVVAAYLSGNAAGSGIEEAGALGIALETHENAALLAMIISIVAAGGRLLLLGFKKYSGVLMYSAVFLTMLAVIAIARTGFYGGELVYKHAAGVNLNVSLQNNESPANIKLDAQKKSEDDDND
jgi:uncharacterized membrane protein